MFQTFTPNSKDSNPIIFKQLEELQPDFSYNSSSFYCTFSLKGMIISYIEVLETNNTYEIISIYVNEKYRHRLYGKKLVKFIENRASKQNIEKIVTKLIQCKGFFEKLDFQLENNEFVYDKINERKKRYNENSKILIFSIIGNIVLAVSKISVGITGKSRSLLADGINSLSDIATSLGMLIGVYYSNIPEDDEHPYGHEKIESVIASILGIIMIVTGFELMKNNFEFLYNFSKVSLHTTPTFTTIYWGLFSAIIKYFMYFYKNKIGIKTGNSALIADAKDSRNDIFTSLGAVLGILLAIYINPIFDILMTFPVALIILKEGFHVIFENTHIIMDKQDKEFLEKIEEYLEENIYVENIHDFKMRSSGNRIFLNMHIRLLGETSISQGHHLSETIENSILTDFPEVKEVLIHIEPIIKQ